MNPSTRITALLFLVTCAFTARLSAGTPEQEKAFLDKYKAAFEASDKATLESFLYTKGAHPMALEFYKMMQTSDIGQKIATIELKDLSAEDAKEASETEELPSGEKVRFPLKPTKKLKITTDSKSESGFSSGSRECFIAEKDGKFVIPVPAAAK